MEAYNQFLNTQILDHPSVHSASSSFALRRVKYTTALPLQE
jgi:DNA-binding Lrp family transcriptional regulator